MDREEEALKELETSVKLLKNTMSADVSKVSAEQIDSMEILLDGIDDNIEILQEEGMDLDGALDELDSLTTQLNHYRKVAVLFKRSFRVVRTPIQALV